MIKSVYGLEFSADIVFLYFVVQVTNCRMGQIIRSKYLLRFLYLIWFVDILNYLSDNCDYSRMYR